MANMKAGNRGNWMGIISLLWVILVISSYVLVPEHLNKCALSFDGFRLWVSADIYSADLIRVLPGHTSAVFTVLIGLSVAWFSGGAVASWFGTSSAPMRIGLGLGAGSLGMFGLGLVGVVYVPVFFAGAFILSLLGWKVAGKGRRGPTLSNAAISSSLIPEWMAWLAAGLAVISALINFIAALAPETGYDSLIQHLADPRAYLALHRISFNGLSFLAQHPAGIEMLYLWLLPSGGDSAARLLHVALGIMAAWAFFHWVRARRSTADAVLLSSMLYLVPFTGILSARSYIDNGLIFYGTLALLASPGSWLQGVFIGLAIGAKYLGGFFLVGWAVALAVSGRWRGAYRVVVGASLVAAWWGIRNIINTGNPVFPFGFKLFGGIGWDAHSDMEYNAELSSYGAVSGFFSHIAIPWLASVRDRGALDDGSLGPLFLAFLPLAVIFRARTAGERLLAWNAGILALLWLISPRQVRYAMALLPLFLAALVPSLEQAVRNMPHARKAGSVAVLVVLPVQFLLSFAAVYLWINPWFVVIGRISRPGYLSGMNEPRDAVTGRSLYMEASDRFGRILPPGSRTYMMGDAKVYYFPDGFTVNALFNPPLFAGLVKSSTSPAEIAKRLRQLGISHVLYNIGGSVHIEFVHRMYRWNSRDLALLESFFGGWMKKVGSLEDSRGDLVYSLYKITPGKYPYPDYLPGIDTRMGAVEGGLAEGRREDSLQAARSLVADYPESGFIRSWLRIKFPAGLGK